MSRRPNWQEGVEKDNEDWKLIKPKWIRGMETVVEEGNLRERIKRAQKGSKSGRRIEEGRDKNIER